MRGGILPSEAAKAAPSATLQAKLAVHVIQ